MGTVLNQREIVAVEQRGFRRFAWGVLAYTVFVVLWGAFVRATGSGAGCGGHWPLCNGDVMPRSPTVETAIEFTHRITSGLSLVLVAWLFGRARRFEKGQPVRRAAALSLVFLIVEALLGAGLVLFDYVAHNASLGRAVYLSLHLANTQVLLAMLTATAWLAGRPALPFRWRPVPKTVLAILPVAVVVVITGAVAALSDTLFPASSLASGVRQEMSETASTLLRLRMVHPAVAVAGALFFLFALTEAIRFKPGPAGRKAAIAAAVLVMVQIVAGAINVVLLAPVWMQLVHLFIADLLWIALVILTIEVVRRPAAQMAR